MAKDKMCRFCGKSLDIKKNGFVIEVIDGDKSFSHLTCFERTEKEDVKERVMADVDDLQNDE